MKAMAFGTELSSRELGNLVRQAAPKQKRWPKISIWHGSRDEVVAPVNGSALVRQWLDIHQVDESGVVLDEVDGQMRRSWRDGVRKVVVEHYAIDGMAHGAPVDAKTHATTAVFGTLAPFALDAGISSTIRIAQSWELLRQPRGRDSEPPPAANGESRFHFLGFWFKCATALK